MSKRPEKDSFIEVTRRKKVSTSKSDLAPNTRSKTFVTTTQKKSSIPTQIDTFKLTSDETSHFSHISRKSTRSVLHAEFAELREEREKQHQEQMLEQQQHFEAQLATQLAELQKQHEKQLTDFRTGYSTTISDYKSTIEGLNFTVQ